MQCVVWWSGVSAINLIDVLPHNRFTEIGCNFIEQFRSVQHVVAYDKQVVDRLPRTDHCTYHTQIKWCNRPNWMPIRHTYWKSYIHDSGTLAVQLASHLSDQPCYVIGADWDHARTSIQDHHYEEFRGYQPPKLVKQKQNWLEVWSERVIWVHVERQPWMRHYINHSDFLALAMSTFH